MEKKYQVFVSSTYEDLQLERQEVIHALLELDCIPSGMELFPAADEDQWSLIAGVIDECDYYVLILGGRYGSVGKDGVGYTEKEYRYALDNGKPIIAFLHKDPESIPRSKTEKDPENEVKLSEFRTLAQKKMCKYWSTAAELGSVVSRSLIMLQKKHPGIGWVRGDLVPSKETTLEILSLRKQIETLEAKLAIARTQAPPGTDGLAQGDEVFPIDYTCSSWYAKAGYTWTPELPNVTWDDIFYHISPKMIHEVSDSDMLKALNRLVELYGKPILEATAKSKGEAHSFSSFQISNEDFQTIKVQLRALGLINKSEKARSVKDTDSYWTLTPYGDSVMNRLRAIKREESVS